MCLSSQSITGKCFVYPWQCKINTRLLIFRSILSKSLLDYLGARYIFSTSLYNGTLKMIMVDAVMENKHNPEE